MSYDQDNDIFQTPNIDSQKQKRINDYASTADEQLNIEIPDAKKKKFKNDLKKIVNHRDALSQQLDKETEFEKTYERQMNSQQISPKEAKQKVEDIYKRKKKLKLEIQNLENEMKDFENIINQQNNTQSKNKQNKTGNKRYSPSKHNATEYSPYQNTRMASQPDIKKLKSLEKQISQQSLKIQKLSMENNILEKQFQKTMKPSQQQEKGNKAKTNKKNVKTPSEISKTITSQSSKIITNNNTSNNFVKQKRQQESQQQYTEYINTHQNMPGKRYSYQNQSNSYQISSQRDSNQISELNSVQQQSLADINPNNKNNAKVDNLNLANNFFLQQQIQQLQQLLQSEKDQFLQSEKANQELLLENQQLKFQIQNNDEHFNSLLEALETRTQEFNQQLKMMKEESLNEKLQLIDDKQKMKEQYNDLFEQHTDELSVYMKKIAVLTQQTQKDFAKLNELTKERDSLQSEIRNMITQLASTPSMMINTSNILKSHSESYENSQQSESIQKSFVENELMHIVKQFRKENDDLVQQLKQNLKHNLELEKQLDDAKQKSKEKNTNHGQQNLLMASQNYQNQDEKKQQDMQKIILKIQKENQNLRQQLDSENINIKSSKNRQGGVYKF